MTRARGASRPRFRLLPTVLLTLAILALPTVVSAWGRNSSSFDVKTMSVAGTRLLSEKQVLRLLHRDYAGRNLFTVTGGDVRETLAPLCLVSGASIDRDFPDRLAVTVSEYEPVAYALAGDRWYVVDRGGYVICRAAEVADQLGATKAAEASPQAGVMPAEGTTSSSQAGGDGSDASLTARLVAGPERAPLALPRVAVSGRVRAGSAIAGDAEIAMLRVIAALPRSLQRELAAVQEDGGQITLRFDGGLLVAWGDEERLLAKTVALRTVLREYRSAEKPCTHLDVSIPDRVLAKPVLK